MGISGLTSFINSHPEFLKDIDLRDTKLVIDGNCVMQHMYFSHKCKAHFGGEYAEFGAHVASFFDDLLARSVTPIVMIDGCLENRKVNTIIKRKQQTIDRLKAADLTKTQIFPPLGMQVFLDVARQKGVTLIQTVFEADSHTAAVAKILDCPVLSNDSDFFIYDVKYIPSSTLRINYARSQDGLVKQLKYRVFDREKFFREYSGMDERFLLPLAAAVLGNDYVNSSVFDNFFSTCRISKTMAKIYEKNMSQMRIAALLRWTQKHESLDSAVAYLINKLDRDRQQVVIEIIETIVNEYLIHSPKVMKETLSFIGYSDEEIFEMIQRKQCDPYKFQRSKDFQVIENKNNEEDIKVDLSRHWSANVRLKCEEYDTVKPEIEDKLDAMIPSWFKDIYIKGDLSSFFLNLLNRQHVFIAPSMEDLSYTSCFDISLRIVSIIFRILSKGTSDAKYFKYTSRGENNKMETYEINSTNFELNCDIPLFENLMKVPEIERKQIFLCALRVSNDSLEKFPSTWRLYLAAIKYWIDSADKIFRTNYHLYPLILMIVNHVVETHIERQSFAEENSNIKSWEQVSFKKSLKDAQDELTEKDCYWANRFFKSKMFINNKQFDITVVHAYSLFQTCLRSSIDLNALLGCPYHRIDVADFFNGSFIYNLVNDLRNFKKLNGRICEIFEKSPTVLQLFVSILVEIQNMLKTC